MGEWQKDPSTKDAYSGTVIDRDQDINADFSQEFRWSNFNRFHRISTEMANFVCHRLCDTVSWPWDKFTQITGQTLLAISGYGSVFKGELQQEHDMSNSSDHRCNLVEFEY